MIENLARTLLHGAAQALGWRVANLLPTWLVAVLAIIAIIVVAV